MASTNTPRGVWIPVDDWIQAFQDAQRAEYQAPAPETHAEIERDFDFYGLQFPEIVVAQ